MLTFVEAISLAGDRTKQNDDLLGVRDGRAWVIDGATDLHDSPLTNYASDASWVAQAAGEFFLRPNPHAEEQRLRDIVRAASVTARHQFEAIVPAFEERWKSPIASLLIVNETGNGILGLDLGDCRVFALDADGAAQVAGGPGDAGDAESKLAARQRDADKPLLEREETMAILRANRAAMNEPGGKYWTFCLDPACADHARAWSIPLSRPAHILLCTDGFSALVDRYGAYDPAGLVRAALVRGLQELGRELRAIETADAGGAKHPRFKASDDATALLLRLT